MYFLKIIMGVLILLLFMFNLMHYFNWKIKLCDSAPRVSFKTFKTMYDLNPNSFFLYDLYFKHQFHLVEFSSYISLLKYKLFLRYLNKQEKNNIRNENTELLIKSFQKDIDDYKNQYEEELKQYSDAIIKQVKKSTERYEKLKGKNNYD